MVSYRCDDKDVEQCLKKLEAQVISAGGWLSDDVIICSNDGNLSIETSLPAESQDKLISLPPKSLLPLEKVSLGLRDDDLYIISSDETIPPEQLALFATYVELCNLTHKISFHRANSPWVTLRDHPDTLKYITISRADSRTVKEFSELSMSSEDADQLVIDTYIKTRTLNFKEGKGIAAKTYKVIMPLIDCLNHHPKAHGYFNVSEKGQEPSLSVVNSKPIANSDEVFVCYGIFDPLDTYITYGYVDKNSLFVRSIPLLIDLKDGFSIKVKSEVGLLYGGDMPPDIADLRSFMPILYSNEDKVLEVSHMIIPPPTSPFALRRVLAELIKEVNPSLSSDDEALEGQVRAAESQIISANTEFFEDLLRHIEEKLKSKPDSYVFEMLKDMVNTQLGNLKKYLLM